MLSSFDMYSTSLLYMYKKVNLCESGNIKDFMLGHNRARNVTLCSYYL